MMISVLMVESKVKSDLRVKALLPKAFSIIQTIYQPGIVIAPQQVTSTKWIIGFNHTSLSFLAYRFLEQLLYPLDLKGGISYGKWDKEELWDSPVVVYAAYALDEAKDLKTIQVLYNANYMEDQLTNMLLKSWSHILYEQSEIQRTLRFSYEIQNPLFLSYGMIKEDWPFDDMEAVELLKVPFYQAYEKLQDYQMMDFKKKKALRCIDLHQAISSESYLVTGLFKKGYATAMAAMNHTTRQNIDYHIHNGSFADERNYAAALVLQLEREELAI